jgi:ankyrin repeat protein
MTNKQPKRKARPGVDEYGRTLLHNALVPIGKEVDITLVKDLLVQGVDPNSADDNNFTPLHFAAQEALPKVAKLLLEAGADPNNKDSFGNPPLLRVKMSPEGIEVTKLLLKHGADPFIENNYGVSAAQLAYDSTADDPMVAQCIEQSADIFRQLDNNKQ